MSSHSLKKKKKKKRVMKANIKASSKQKHLNQSAYRSFYCSLRSLFTDSADMPTMNIHQQDISRFSPG